MSDKQFRETVIKMRAAANAWFRFHRHSDLVEAKRLEKIIDDENDRWIKAEKAKAVADMLATDLN